MSAGLRAEILARLDDYDRDHRTAECAKSADCIHAAVRALRMVVQVDHIPHGPDRACLTCRWIDPCPTIVNVARNLGVGAGLNPGQKASD